MLFAALALLLPLAAVAEPFGKPLQKICAQLRERAVAVEMMPSGTVLDGVDFILDVREPTGDLRQ
jgi:hypothetical protein